MERWLRTPLTEALRWQRRTDYGLARMVAGSGMWHIHRMNSALVIASVAGLLVFGAGSVVAYFAIRSAPEGFEDAEGFHALEIGTKSKQATSTRAAESHDGVIGLAA